MATRRRATRRPPWPRPRLRRLHIPRRTPARIAAVALLAAGLGAGGFLLLRDSSLFAIRQVQVTGVDGAEADRMASALRAAARGMTTLNLDEGALRRSVASFPQVRDVRARRDGRNGLRVRVIEHVPVGAVELGGQRIPVTGEGMLLRGVVARGELPTVPVRAGATGRRLADPTGLRAVAVLAAAPPLLRSRIEDVGAGSRGLTASLREGPAIHFGTAGRLRAKWAAAAAILVDDAASGARYLDVRTPERAAAGGFPVVEEPEDPASAPDGAPVPQDGGEDGTSASTEG